MMNDFMEKKKTGTIWKPISIGGTSAIMFVLGSSLLDVENVPERHESMEQPTREDEMSFKQAFAEARSQQGPNGSFKWRGQNYSTSTREEWDNLTEVQQVEIAEQVTDSSPVEVEEVEDVAEVAEVPEEVEVTEDLDVSVMDEDVAQTDVEVLEENPEQSPLVSANALDDDDFGDDDVRMVGVDNLVDEDSYAAIGDGDQDIYVINLDDVDDSELEDQPLDEVPVEEIDIDINQHIDISTVVDYEEPSPEEDGLMGEGVDSYFA